MIESDSEPLESEPLAYAVSRSSALAIDAYRYLRSQIPADVSGLLVSFDIAPGEEPWNRNALSYSSGFR